MRALRQLSLRELRRHAVDDTGAATAEYAITIMAAVSAKPTIVHSQVSIALSPITACCSLK